MFLALALAALFTVVPVVASGQALGVLHVKVTLTDGTRAALPVPRHALLISDNPTTSSPTRVVTAPDGTVDVRLSPGNYTVESDEPVSRNGKFYQWTQNVDITAGRDVVLELTAENAEINAAATASQDNDPWLLVSQWNDSVVGVWTPQARASGFVVDGMGLVVTSQRVIGSAAVAEVQLTPSVKVAARVLVADRTRDVAVLWIDPMTAGSVRPIPLACSSGARPSFVNGQKLVAIGAPLRGQKELSPGEMIRVEPHDNVADIRLAPGGTGGPVFSASGAVVGISSLIDDQDERRRRARIVPVDEACEVVRSAEKAMKPAPRPAGTMLPVEPLQLFPADALAAAAKRRAGNLIDYQIASSDFEITFLTPVLVYAAQAQQENAGGRQSTPGQEIQRYRQIAATDFGDWSDYFTDAPSVLAIRVTPKMAESFWTTFARGAAYTQGVALPAIKHFKPGIAELHVFCGDVEVIPIHPFILERRVSETDAVREGLYIFDPQAIGPHCQSVKLTLHSEKAPKKPETRAVDSQVIEQIWQDFAPYRELVASGDARR